MAYIDRDKMVAEFGESELIQLTDRDGSTGAIVDATLMQAMTNAESEMDSYIGGRYPLPLPMVPEVLRSFACDIARYRLYDAKPTDEVSKRYDRAVSWLRDLAKGIVSLGIKATEEAPTDQVVISDARAQVFTDTLFGTMGPKWPTQ
jgi:phage gp36-like protein